MRQSKPNHNFKAMVSFPLKLHDGGSGIGLNDALIGELFQDCCMLLGPSWLKLRFS